MKIQMFRPPDLTRIIETLGPNSRPTLADLGTMAAETLAAAAEIHVSDEQVGDAAQTIDDVLERIKSCKSTAKKS